MLAECWWHAQHCMYGSGHISTEHVSVSVQPTRLRGLIQQHVLHHVFCVVLRCWRRLCYLQRSLRVLC
jgi:hypothetical protein